MLSHVWIGLLAALMTVAQDDDEYSNWRKSAGSEINICVRFFIEDGITYLENWILGSSVHNGIRL